VCYTGHFARVIMCAVGTGTDAQDDVSGQASCSGDGRRLSVCPEGAMQCREAAAYLG